MSVQLVCDVCQLLIEPTPEGTKYVEFVVDMSRSRHVHTTGDCPKGLVPMLNRALVNDGALKVTLFKHTFYSGLDVQTDAQK